MQDTKEALTNKATDFSTVNDTKYPTTKAVSDQLALKADKTYVDLNYPLKELPNGVLNSYDTAKGALVKRVGYLKLTAADIEASSNNSGVIAIAITRAFTDTSFSNLMTGNVLIVGKQEIPNDSDYYKPYHVGKFFTADSQKLGFILPYNTKLADARDLLAGTEIYYQLGKSKSFLVLQR